MKFINVTMPLGLAVLLFAGQAVANISCDALLSEIETKIKNNGVKAFTLTILPKDETSDLRVIGTCDGGTKKIVYKRG
jgi:hypothetical protein